MSQLAPNLAKILADSEAVRHGTESVLKILEEVLKLRWVVGVGDDSCKMFILFITDANNPDSVELIGDFSFCLLFTRAAAGSKDTYTGYLNCFWRKIKVSEIRRSERNTEHARQNKKQQTKEITYQLNNYLQ